MRDDQVKNLPQVPTDHPLRKEWSLRQNSCHRFDKWLQQHYAGQQIRLLDLGCGNGWMAANLARKEGREIIATDLNMEELTQGRRVFSSPVVQFVYADLFQRPFPENHFDVVYLAAALQYFPDLAALSTEILRIVKPGGTVHCIDTPFYPTPIDAAAAAERTQQYYTSQGFPQMAEYYHHHCLPEAEQLGWRSVDRGIYARCLRKLERRSPFPWIILSKEG